MLLPKIQTGKPITFYLRTFNANASIYLHTHTHYAANFNCFEILPICGENNEFMWFFNSNFPFNLFFSCGFGIHKKWLHFLSLMPPETYVSDTCRCVQWGRTIKSNNTIVFAKCYPSAEFDNKIYLHHKMSTNNNNNNNIEHKKYKKSNAFPKWTFVGLRSFFYIIGTLKHPKHDFCSNF